MEWKVERLAAIEQQVQTTILLLLASAEVSNRLAKLSISAPPDNHMIM